MKIKQDNKKKIKHDRALGLARWNWQMSVGA